MEIVDHIKAAVVGLCAVSLMLLGPGGAWILVYRWADLRGLLGRPALGVHDPRQLLIVGTMGSGTTQKAAELSALGLEFGHEMSDSRERQVRDGTVSWAHGLRFLRRNLNEAEMEEFCSKPRTNTWLPTMFESLNGCKRNPSGLVWDSCWASECRRVAAAGECVPQPAISPSAVRVRPKKEAWPCAALLDATAHAARVEPFAVERADQDQKYFFIPW